MRPLVAVIGIGNPWRGDDGIGWAVADVVRHRIGPAVDVIESDGEPGRLLDMWGGLDVAVVVDAVSSGAPPGTLHVRTVAPDQAVTVPPGAGSHGLGLRHAIALGHILRRLPARFVVVGVEIGDTAHGHRLTPEVAGVVEAAAGVVVRLIDDHSGRNRASDHERSAGAAEQL